MLFVCAAGVTGLDLCLRRPVVATCSLDHTVRLWNYADRSCDLNKSFAEEAYSIAVHPTGLMVSRHKAVVLPRPECCCLTITA